MSGQATRAVPYLCPFCGEEDLRPVPAPAGSPADGPDRAARWHCRCCLRVFSVAFHGLATPEVPAASADPVREKGATW